MNWSIPTVESGRRFAALVKRTSGMAVMKPVPTSRMRIGNRKSRRRGTRGAAAVSGPGGAVGADKREEDRV